MRGTGVRNYVLKLSAWLQVLLLCLMTGAGTVQAADTEHRIKAAFLYNFVRFVNWPEQSDSTFRLCYLANDQFSAAIESLTGKNVQGNVLVVEQHQDANTMYGCQAVYIDESHHEMLGKLMSELRGRPILTISDIDKFSESGGMIGFHRIDNKIRFSVNVRAANEVELSISSKLLSLASKVITEHDQ